MRDLRRLERPKIFLARNVEYGLRGQLRRNADAGDAGARTGPVSAME